MFEGSNIPLKKWFIAMYIFVSHKKGISSHQLAKDLGITQKSAWFMLGRIRNCFKQAPEIFGLNGEIVEADETVVGGKVENKRVSYRKKVHANKIHPMDNKSIVVGIIQRQGTLSLKVIDKRSEIFPTVTKNVSTEASLITDTSGVYLGVYKTHPKHEVVDHSKDEFVRGIYHTNTIEGVFSLLDRMIIGIYHHVSPKHIQKYCDELSFRYNTRKQLDGDRFRLSLQIAKEKISYRMLINK